MGNVETLSPEALRRVCDPAGLSFETTRDLTPLEDSIGHARASRAIHFGVGIEQAGYNLYLLGPSGTGKHTMVRHFLEAKAAERPVPSDLCYVNNFVDPHRPRALMIPAGRGMILREDMKTLVQELGSAIPAAFESEDFRRRKQAIDAEFDERREQALEALRKRAEEKSIAVIRTPFGLALAPIKEGGVLTTEAFEKLPEEDQERIATDQKALEKELAKILRETPQWQAEKRRQLQELAKDIARFAVGHHIDVLLERYRDLPSVAEYLDAVRTDILGNADRFLQAAAREDGAPFGLAEPEAEEPPFIRRYVVNVVVDRSGETGVPVLYEDHPSYNNIMGRVEHISRLGTLVTDFTLIKPGALHRANGGYLVLDARKVLSQPFVWEELKRTMRSGVIRIESVAQMLSLASTVSLEPEPVSLDIKVVLMGDRLLYYLLATLDPEFSELFKVPVDFDDSVDRTAETSEQYARLVAALATKEQLRPLDRDAVARVIEEGSRRAADQEKLSIHMSSLVDLLREADFWAAEDDRSLVTGVDVQRAVDAQIDRAGRLHAEIGEHIRRGNILIDTTGTTVGQVNGLSVYNMGGRYFGKPTRITARVQVGKGEVIDIEREVELGGPIHSKGVLILSGFLGGRFASEQPLSLSASLVFEQTYSQIEGDSASSAELYALLSALAEVPIRQGIAVTGSVNQCGRIQAIGGVNEKIEGFFDVCEEAALTGDQAVIIPASNVKNLMLRRDVVAAVAEGRFHIYAVETVDQGIEILTGIAAGERDETGAFPRDTLNARVEAKLAFLGERALAARGGARDAG